MNVTVDFGTTLIVAPSIVGIGSLVLQNGALILTARTPILEARRS